MTALAAAAFLGGVVISLVYAAGGPMSGDESIYLSVARQTARTGLPQRPGGLPFAEHPPLVPYLAAAGMVLFGLDAIVAVRALFSVAVALALYGGTYWLTRDAFGPRGAAWALVLLTGSHVVMRHSGHVTLDLLATGVTALALAAVSRALDPGRLRPGPVLAAAGLLAAGVLVKYPVALVAPAALAWVVLRPLAGGPRPTWRLACVPVLVGMLGLAPAVGWSVVYDVARGLPVGEGFWFHLSRVGHAREVGRLGQPLSATLLRLLYSLGPGLLVLALVGFAAGAGADTSTRSKGFFLGLWTAAVLVFFSVSGIRTMRYFLPLVPAVAALGGAALARVDWRRLGSGRRRWAATPLGVGLLGFVAVRILTPRVSIAGQSFLVEELVFVVVGLAGIALLIRRPWRASTHPAGSSLIVAFLFAAQLSTAFARFGADVAAFPDRPAAPYDIASAELAALLRPGEVVIVPTVEYAYLLDNPFVCISYLDRRAAVRLLESELEGIGWVLLATWEAVPRGAPKGWKERFREVLARHFEPAQRCATGEEIHVHRRREGMRPLDPTTWPHK